MPTSVKENYLKALYFLEEQDSRVGVTELSKRLSVSKPTASNMVKRLEEGGYVQYEKYKPLQLTSKGRKAAALVIRKHRLTEMFLFKVMGFGWEEVHEIAEEIEHIDSALFFDRMDQMLDRPAFDPHGSPIPDAEGNVAKHQLKTLFDSEPGGTYKLVALAHSSKELLHYLNQVQVELGVQIELVNVEAFDQSCMIRVNERPAFPISRKVAESLLVD